MKIDKRKAARKGSAAKRPKGMTVQERAEWITLSPDYSDETRAAIKDALTNNPRGLERLVRRAESGEEIVNITDAKAEADDEHEKVRTYKFSAMHEIEAEKFRFTEQQIKDLACDVFGDSDRQPEQITALLTLLYAASLPDHINERREVPMYAMNALAEDLPHVEALIKTLVMEHARGVQTGS
jgi:hypothetical protein